MPLTVPENSTADTRVGGLNTLDPDIGDQFTYVLAPGEGAIDNGRFTITTSGQIRVAANAVLNFERSSSLRIRVGTTDQGGLSLETPLTVQVTDVDEAPIVDHIVPPANGSYRAGQPL
ncbi:MAG: cadherin repeat domain-containing protein [Planctomycetes bacterium]|nr:cadherin repeat domain-containing protein [Planctomycetota bacterium]